MNTFTIRLDVKAQGEKKNKLVFDIRETRRGMVSLEEGH